jgi:hypothetical protein
VPFIRYTRDKRGYETTFVMHAYRPAQGPQRTRVLYLFRAPAHIKMGRRPLDEEAREALEHTHPDLSFDWSALGRDSEDMRAYDRAHDRERERESPGRGRRQQQQQQTRQQKPAPAPVVVVEDETLLGRTVGGATAVRLRARYADLLQRILRRARTPEDRDRLTEHAHRLNPDDWASADVVKARVSTVEAEWDALLAQLPARRRGRRGGRRREGGGDNPSSVAPGADVDLDADAVDDAPDALPEAAAASEIMAADGESNVVEDVRDAVGPRDDGGDRADADRLGPDENPSGRGTGNGIQSDDEFRQD